MSAPDDQPTLILVDGSSYLYRAFFALPPLNNSRGEPTGAVFGVINMLQRYTRDRPDNCVVVVFDAPGKTFRDELYAEYKSHRPPMPDDMRSQTEPLLELVQALGYPLLRIPGVEADDVIGTIAVRAAAEGRKVLISTGDKDMAQLVNDRITLINTMTNTALDRDGVKAKFDVWPEQIIDYLALVGDSSDNIPGIDKVGPKTAAKWLGTYGNLDNLIANALQISGKVGENLRAGLETLALSRQLATIQTDVELPPEANMYARREPDRPRLRELYTRMEFRGMLRALDTEEGAASPKIAPGKRGATASGDAGADAGATAAASADVAALAAVPRAYETILSEESLERWLALLDRSELTAFDTETTSLNYNQARIVGMSFSVEPGKAAYLPLAHRYAGAPEQLDLESTLARLKPWLEDASRGKVGHHLKYDAHVLRNHGIELRGFRHDSMIESYVLNSVATRHDMDSVVKFYLGIDTIKYEAVAGKGAKQIGFDQVPVETASTYAAEDADVTLRAHLALWPQLAALPKLKALYEEIERPLAEVLFEMEHRGVLLDPALLRQQSGEIGTRLGELQKQIHTAAGGEFNPDSPKQLQQILFEKLQLPVIRKTPSGQPSTAEDVLQELAETGFELPQLILEYRGLAKLKSTYTDKLPAEIDERTGRVHTCYHQAVAATGRLSSTDPNLQNIPIRNAEGRRIRQAFIAPPGQVLMAADYSQIELRIMAHLSDDATLVRAFAQDRDVHQATAAEVLGKPIEEVTTDERRSAKAVNFGLIYGMSAFGLAKQLGIDRGAAQRYVDLYFDRYPGVKQFMDRTRNQAREQGYVETVRGRRLYLPDIRSSNRNLQQYAERSAINAPMQGTAADIIKLAMLRVEHALVSRRLPARLIMQVHDELVLEVQKDAVDEISALLRELMTGAETLKVPLKVDIGVGSNWDQAH